MRHGREKDGHVHQGSIDGRVVVIAVGRDRRLGLGQGPKPDAGEVVLARTAADVLEVGPERPLGGPEDVAQVRVAVDRRAVEREQMIGEGAQLRELGCRGQHVEHVQDLAEPVARRQLAVVLGERVVELAQRAAGQHGIGPRRIVVDEPPERDQLAVALVRPRIDVVRGRRDRRARSREELRRAHLGVRPRAAAERAERQLYADDDRRGLQVDEDVREIPHDARPVGRQSLLACDRKRGIDATHVPKVAGYMPCGTIFESFDERT